MREKTLSEKIIETNGFCNEINNDYYEHDTNILLIEDVKQFIKEILDEINFAHKQEVEDGVADWVRLYRVIKQKAGFKELKW